jgi:hypothetical protein
MSYPTQTFYEDLQQWLWVVYCYQKELYK